MFHFLHSGGERIYYTFVVVSELKPFIDCRHGPLPGRRFQHCYRRFDVSVFPDAFPNPTWWELPATQCRLTHVLLLPGPSEG